MKVVKATFHDISPFSLTRYVLLKKDFYLLHLKQGGEN